MIPIDVSPGEALDRLSILRVKQEKGPPEWQDRIRRDIADLDRVVRSKVDVGPVESQAAQLRSINGQLWDMENDMRALEPPAGLGKLISNKNHERSRAKNMIDTFFRVEAELKKYG